MAPGDEEKWASWTYGDSGLTMRRDPAYINSIQNFFNAGLDIGGLLDAVDIAGRTRISDYRIWRYFCGVCWRIIRERQEIARALLETEE